ncbi:hypothetical protein LAZ67_11000284 [Cordylochernes scorpioides]|uniref:Uncharacterized protein n=1 Tax=Cordylochernes scorpioides TaxID=51811 RepID=A0ABY6L0I2_9ARAC|nr:hypothetical protein LAZ67_11000284 [Cordylochernes scorpioides]
MTWRTTPWPSWRPPRPASTSTSWAWRCGESKKTPSLSGGEPCQGGGASLAPKIIKNSPMTPDSSKSPTPSPSASNQTELWHILACMGLKDEREVLLSEIGLEGLSLELLLNEVRIYVNSLLNTHFLVSQKASGIKNLFGRSGTAYSTLKSANSAKRVRGWLFLIYQENELAKYHRNIGRFSRQNKRQKLTPSIDRRRKLAALGRCQSHNTSFGKLRSVHLETMVSG